MIRDLGGSILPDVLTRKTQVSRAGFAKLLGNVVEIHAWDGLVDGHVTAPRTTSTAAATIRFFAAFSSSSSSGTLSGLIILSPSTSPSVVAVVVVFALACFASIDRHALIEIGVRIERQRVLQHKPCSLGHGRGPAGHPHFLHCSLGRVRL